MFKAGSSFLGLFIKHLQNLQQQMGPISGQKSNLILNNFNRPVTVDSEPSASKKSGFTEGSIWH